MDTCVPDWSVAVYRDDYCHGVYRQPKSLPTVILIGNFLVPITFVAFLYDHAITAS